MPISFLHHSSFLYAAVDPCGKKKKLGRKKKKEERGGRCGSMRSPEFFFADFPRRGGREGGKKGKRPSPLPVLTRFEGSARKSEKKRSKPGNLEGWRPQSAEIVARPGAKKKKKKKGAADLSLRWGPVRKGEGEKKNGEKGKKGGSPAISLPRPPLKGSFAREKERRRGWMGTEGATSTCSRTHRSGDQRGEGKEVKERTIPADFAPTLPDPVRKKKKTSEEKERGQIRPTAPASCGFDGR